MHGANCQKNLKKSEDPYIGLLAYRTSPIHTGLFPAELVMSRHLRGNIAQMNNHVTTIVKRASYFNAVTIVLAQEVLYIFCCPHLLRLT